ncbi:MAG TPA: peptide-methionine (R)-S-oxide reductase MsrB [Burkholderiales bacterium]|nr:peptide-methionine (R)-S-oxide reductase MsrB [Burkholderiales bacterium]
MKRRAFLSALAATALLLTPRRILLAADSPASPSLADIRGHWKTLLAPGADVAVSAAPLRLSADEWRRRLTPQQYAVLREEDTERAFTSPLNHETRPGVFVCAGCALPLFTSEMKFDSGTGWPSFFTTIPDAFATRTDLQLIYPRTEYHCVKCGGHHGHVFDDGPPPTGQRWCNNGVALRFIPRG